MDLSYNNVIDFLDEKNEKINGDYVIQADPDTDQKFLLVIEKSNDLRTSVKKIESQIIIDSEEVEKPIRQYGIIFTQEEVAFLRIRPGSLQIKVQKLYKKLDKITPLFQTKFENLFEDLGEIMFWERLFLRDDVIEEFYYLYALSREKMITNIKGISDDTLKEEFVEDLLLQLLIIWYLQEKNFLNQDKKYLINMFRKFKELGFKTYYDFLGNLFDRMKSQPDEDIFINDERLGRIVVTGTAPFLNGEYEKVELSDNLFYKENHTAILIKTEPKHIEIAPILNLLESRDWTEGNIDEYVLGAIYEKIISFKERKESGAFYTPEAITAYICEENINAFLIGKLNNLNNESFSNIKEVFQTEDENLLFLVFNVLKDVKIADPAVGSAHFLESAIEYLLKLYKMIRERLLTLGIKEGLEVRVIGNDGKIKPIDLLNLEEEELFNLYVKFFIILSKNIYGVDINPRALKVARARLFLSLAKHFDLDQKYFLMFPNIHFNLRPGNSLIGYTELNQQEFPEGQGLMGFIQTEPLTKLYHRLKLVFELKQYLNEVSEGLDLKTNIEEEINQLNKILSKTTFTLIDFKKVLRVKDFLVRILIVSLNSTKVVLLNSFLKDLTKYFNNRLNERFCRKYDFSLDDLNIAKSLHWILEFPEVFLKRKGFDIIIGNPPYFRITNAPKKEQEILGELDYFQGLHHGQGDIFYDFIVRSYYLLNEGGHFMFIVSRYWPEAAYSNYLKTFLKEKVNVLKIIDFRELKIFKGVDINNTIISYKKEAPNEKNKFFEVYIYEKKQKELVGEINPLEVLEYCGKYDITKWNKNENWVFLVEEYMDIYSKIKNIHARIKDAFICSQNNMLSKPYRDKFTFEEKPDEIPNDLFRPSRQSGDTFKYTVRDDLERCVMVIHDLKAALEIKTFSEYLEENEIELTSIKEVPPNSNKNVDKFDEVIFIGFRVPRLDFWFIYSNNHDWVFGSYFYAVKPKIKGNLVQSMTYLLGVLNSKLIKFYLDVMGKKKDADLELGTSALLDIPIKLNNDTLNKKEKDLIQKIETNIKEILDLERNGSAISMKQDAVDLLVYELYRIGEEEQERIEKYIKNTKKLL
ncbi:MAG: Eco57I restriction-modification methylase domain-containing protein [Patescibacteria group bacterium]|nr:Eco57I restriction-modification methylase domain-containing protein [Patescibacteria group bacterium]